eukprot:scaffold3464_cov406-Prasinococcus_capsulatus_cf.AAC.2
MEAQPAKEEASVREPAARVARRGGWGAEGAATDGRRGRRMPIRPSLLLARVGRRRAHAA